MDCYQAHLIIHEFLDGDIAPQNELLLKQHLCECQDCRNHLQALKQTIVVVRSSSHFCAPSGFTERVIARLPRETVFMLGKKKLQRHPFLVAASLFVLFMTGSAFSLWTENRQFQLIAYQPQQLVIDKERNQVIVPAHKVVHGDIVVRNADISVQGEVEGNVVAIDGHIYMASTGSVTGDKEEINEVVQWVWYSLKRAVHQLIP